MSKEHLVEAYLRGEVSRRQFIKRLVAAGVSMTAALAYAEMSPQLAHADHGRNHGKNKGRGHHDADDHRGKGKGRRDDDDDDDDDD
jgi:hypothetical protein